MRSDAIWLAKSELSRSKIPMISTALFFFLYGGITATMSSKQLMTEFGGQLPSSMQYTTDFVLLAMMSVICFGFAKGYFLTPFWKTDYFTVQLSVMRSLPIPVKALALQRIYQMIVYAAITAPGFFLMFYLFSEWARVTFNPAQYILYALCWTAYGFILGTIYICMEWGMSGKKYLAGSLIVCGIIFAIKHLFLWVFHIHLAFALADLVTGRYGWAVAAFMVLLGITVVLLGMRRLVHILNTRDFR